MEFIGIAKGYLMAFFANIEFSSYTIGSMTSKPREVLKVNNLEYERYIDKIRKLADRFREEVKSNIEHVPNESGVIEYLDQISVEISNLNGIIQEVQHPKLQYDYEGNAEQFMNKSEHEDLYIQINSVFRNAKQVLRDLLDDLVLRKRNFINTRTSERSLSALKKLKWNGQRNQLADIFYQLKNTLETKEGKKFIEGDDKDIAEIIIQCFVGPDGRIQ